jgi:nucleotide-binding universal stress UspA family protein
MGTTDNDARVVVGYDDSDSATVAVGWAADEADRLALPLVVVYAADCSGLVGGPVGRSPLPGAAMDRALRVAGTGVRIARARHRGLDVSARTFTGSAATVLVLESEGAALVVVGTRGRGEHVGPRLGSVASRVAAHAHCPVAVVHGGDVVTPGHGHPVVVGVDGSRAARSALRAAVARADAAAATLRIVCAWLPAVPDGWRGARWTAIHARNDADDRARRAATDVALDAEVAARLMAPGLTAEVRVGRGHPASVVLDAAGDAGLLVVGARGRGSVASLFLGSVSHGVVHRAPCPVLVVRAGVEPPRPALATT